MGLWGGLCRIRSCLSAGFVAVVVCHDAVHRFDALTQLLSFEKPSRGAEVLLFSGLHIRSPESSAAEASKRLANELRDPLLWIPGKVQGIVVLGVCVILLSGGIGTGRR